MLKLTEPQERVLRTLWRHKLHIGVNIWQDGYWEVWWAPPDFSRPHLRRRPNIRTLQSLERKGFLKRESEGVPSFRLFLTPEGRETAKELWDAETE